MAVVYCDRAMQMTGDVWNAERLRQCVASRYAGESIVVVANREPFRHDRTPDGAVAVRRSASGVVTALEPVVRACSGVWVAHGSGTADRMVVDRRDGLDVPPATPRERRPQAKYRLRRVWLDEREERGYYYGFANEGLWPLCHRAHVQPKFRSGDFAIYADVNRRFAEAVCEEAESESPLVLVQDYHFALAPRTIRQHLPLSTIITFWHIPWPGPRDFAICPWARALVDGLLRSDIIGFQTADDCATFVETVAATRSGHINRSRNVITTDGGRTMVRPYPVSVAYPDSGAPVPRVEACRTAVLRELGLPDNIRLGVGVDRLDYTKGIEEKLLAVERLLESHPELRDGFAFVQIAEPSRACLSPYRALRARLAGTIDRINSRFGTPTHRPVIVREAHHDPAEVYRFLRAADLCYVGSLHDGMNLVAKEFVAARDDERGVLVLSRFTGAARELTSALVVNPYAIDKSAEALARALAMPAGEQSRRMRAMRATVREFNAYRWAGQMLEDAARLRSESPRSRHSRRGECRPLRDTRFVVATS